MSGMSVQVVPIENVSHSERYKIPIMLRLVRQILKKQGLIEPLIVKKGTLQLKGNAWDDERLEAAKQLGWETVIVTDDDEDE